MITFVTKLGYWIVYLDGEKVGNIVRTPEGFVYHPIGSAKHKGEAFDTLEACKASLTIGLPETFDVTA